MSIGFDMAEFETVGWIQGIPILGAFLIVYSLFILFCQANEQVCHIFIL